VSSGGGRQALRKSRRRLSGKYPAVTASLF
jgi:hypothetical protein